jgi:hypothetical protein
MQRNNRLLQLGLALTAMVLGASLLVASVASAQLRYVQGNIDGRIRAYEPHAGLSTTVTTFGGRVCPTDPGCAGGAYPFLAANPGMKPIRPAGAVVSGGTSPGQPVQMPYALEWYLETGGILPGGLIPGVNSIQTFFKGGNDIATTLNGDGFSMGGGAGNKVLNPVASGYGNYDYQTFTFAAATSPLGSTTPSGPKGTITTHFQTLPPQPNNIFAATITQGPNVFGGTAAILADTPNTLNLAFPSADYLRTNGRCDPSEPFGTCAFGVSPGEGLKLRTSARRYQAQTISNMGGFLVQHWRWFGDLWTTGTVTAHALIGNEATSFGSSGTDHFTGGGQRELVLVTPYLAYGNGLTGAPEGNAQIYKWNMLFVPEPMAGAGLAAGLGLLGMAFFRSRKG